MVISGYTGASTGLASGVNFRNIVFRYLVSPTQQRNSCAEQEVDVSRGISAFVSGSQRDALLNAHVNCLEGIRPEFASGGLFFSNDTANGLARKKFILAVRDVIAHEIARDSFFLPAQAAESDISSALQADKVYVKWKGPFINNNQEFHVYTKVTEKLFERINYVAGQYLNSILYSINPSYFGRDTFECFAGGITPKNVNMKLVSDEHYKFKIAGNDVVNAWTTLNFVSSKPSIELAIGAFYTFFKHVNGEAKATFNESPSPAIGVQQFVRRWPTENPLSCINNDDDFVRRVLLDRNFINRINNYPGALTFFSMVILGTIDRSFASALVL